MKKEIREGDMIPKYYGVAYRNWDSMSAVCYPIPLNIVMGAARKTLLWFKHGHKLYEDGYSRGYQEGMNNGRGYAFNQYKTQALQSEVDTIVKNYLSEWDRVRGLSEQEQIGWIIRFIENETKRISEKH